MAHKDIEVEIKLRLTEKQFIAVKDKLCKIAAAKKDSSQVDEYFTPVHRNFLDYDYPYEWLRIGRRGDKTILNYKHFHPENMMPFTHCDEFETEVTSPEKLQKIFSSLDIKPLVTVDKKREAFIYKDEFEVALDTVKELGQFVEIEAIKDFGGIDETRKRIRSFAESLGIDPNTSVERGYPYLLMEQKGLLK